MSQWIPICRVEDIPVLGSRRVARDRACDVAIFRNAEDKVFALLDRCPHKGGPLSQGIVFGESVACPLHNWTIGLADGCAKAPDEGCTQRFAVKVEARDRCRWTRKSCAAWRWAPSLQPMFQPSPPKTVTSGLNLLPLSLSAQPCWGEGDCAAPLQNTTLTMRKKPNPPAPTAAWAVASSLKAMASKSPACVATPTTPPTSAACAAKAAPWRSPPPRRSPCTAASCSRCAASKHGTPAYAVSWDDALHEATERFGSIIEQHGADSVGFYLSGQLLTEDYYVFNKLGKGLIGTNNVDTNSRLCMSSAAAGYKATLGRTLPLATTTTWRTPTRFSSRAPTPHGRIPS
jgi:nitrite reductase (NADH) small subunit